ncbi:DUF2283 domain-containing protein [Moorella sp. Hama-1]|uniref:DUF2283 domain-containing protein n=1 Tax=Moorella sp. Hama-1 TaxID=2138101 RepID=UPI000D649377|nr:DUF2283 domain-containing protein [Moorella sp. Hama-1]BCV20086.1 hypothetical protein hamaS1_01550 [Moorella sp. Hama-1]
MEKADVMGIMQAIPYLTRMPVNHMWIDYDREADVLYLTFSKEPADDTEIGDDDILFRYKGEALVGITIIRASQRLKG